VIVNYNSRKLGFIVDELIGKHETVIKTLEKNYKNIKGLTGASIMGDGTIILVLDIGGLIDITTTSSVSSSHLVGKEMMRLNTSRSIDVNTSNVIFKTQSSTNLFNNSLLGLQLVDKTKRKKDKSERKKVASEPEQITPVAEVSEPPSEEIKPVQTKPEEIKKENQYLIVPETNLPEKKNMNVEQKQVSNSVNVENLGDSSEEDHVKARELLKGFSDQTKKRVEQLIPDRPINEMLSKEEIRKLESVVNTGMMNAGLVLSQLVGSNVELFMPEIMLTDKDELVNEVRDSNEHFFGMKVRMNGDLNGNLLMIFSEARGKELAGKLLKENETSDLAKKLSDDSLSVLMEISNIVCSSVMNSLSNKAKAQIMPSVPELVTGNFKEVLDVVKPEKTKFLSMNTEFIYEGDNLIGNLLFLPDFDELVKLISRLA